MHPGGRTLQPYQGLYVDGAESNPIDVNNQAMQWLPIGNQY
jgi:hypothetical protein